MLQTLHIENVAIVTNAVIEFDEKLNVISGETGAGKSIMLDSLSFVLGGRADKSLIRTGCDRMKVEAIFSLNDKDKIFINNILEQEVDGELFVSRTLDINGRNTCTINGELVPVNIIKKICQKLVDIHGQSEHLAILNNDYQLEIIDLFSKNSEKYLIKLNENIEKLKEIEKNINLLGGSEQEKQNLIDLYSYQINEIEKAKIQENEYEELMQEKNEMQQFEKIMEALKISYEALKTSGFGESAVERLVTAEKSYSSISSLSEKYSSIFERLTSARIEIDDIADTINNEINNTEFNEERFNFVDSRIDEIKTLFRKYGGNFEELSKYYNEIQNKLDNLINSQEKYEKLNKEKEELLIIIDEIQEKLSFERKNSAKILKEKMQKELRILGMPNALMDIEFSKISERFSLKGYDKVEYMFSSNLGFEMKPLNKVVSGGEMSRVMLAYKIVVSEVDDIHTIIFDEVDSGLSGNIASVVAEYMARLSLCKQIIAVSHLPQICAMADHNIKVEKGVKDGMTVTKSTVLTNIALYEEIARLMGADTDENGISVSKALKEKCNKFKNNL